RIRSLDLYPPLHGLSPDRRATRISGPLPPLRRTGHPARRGRARPRADRPGLEVLQKMATEPEGLFGVIYAEELHWGCAGIALAIQASSLAAAGIASSGTPEQIGRWVPECYGLGDEIKLGAYAVTEPGAGSAGGPRG